MVASENERGPDPRRGIFETILIYDDRPVELEAHLERLAASARSVYGKEIDDYRNLVTSAARGGGLGRLRLDVVQQPDGLVPSVIVAAVNRANVFPTGEFEVGLETLEVEVGQGEHKWADRDPLMRAEARCGSRAVPLLVTAGGTVLEASRANVFAVAGGELLTPPLDGRILPGIARRRVLELASKLDIEASERELTLAELRTAEEVFLTGSIRGVEPVRDVDGDDFPPSREVTSRLGVALRERWLRD